MEILRRSDRIGNGGIIVYLALVLLMSVGAEVACAMEVTPIDDFASSGVVGGPFNPPSKQYQLKNTGLDSLVWGIDKDAYWLDLDEEFGTLDPNETATVTVSINSNADTLPAGAHTDTLTFVDITNDQIQTREVVLTVIGLQGLLYVTPAENFESVGVIGGPFIPSSKEYLLTNIGGQSLFWGADVNEDWLELDDTFGSLDPSQSITITVSLTTTAATLPVDLYTDIVIFQDLTNTQEYTRDAVLTVRPWLTFHVDVVSGDDNNDGLSRETAFETIQKAIETAGNGDWILVWPGVYQESINYLGKNITLTSAEGAAILQAPPDANAVTMKSGEEANSVLTNFVIRDSVMAVFLDGASPTLKNLTVVNNEYGIGAYSGAEPDISNCIFWNNVGDDLINYSASYSWGMEDIDPNYPIEGQVSYWKLNDANGVVAVDSVGSNHGTVHSATWTNGILDAALDFDGSNDYVEVYNNASLEPGDGILTVSAWIKADYLASNDDNQIVSKWHNGGYILYYDCYDRKLYFAVKDSSDIRRDVGVPFSDTNNWHHVCGVNNGTNVSIFIDGNETIGDVISGYTVNSESLYIGCYDGYGGYFNGKIDDVIIYNRALSTEEIQQMYQEGFKNHSGFADPFGGDYHLLSQRGRYRPSTDEWLLDDITSLGVDGGDPMDNPSGERIPNGGRINMGAYGGTAYASMSDWPLTEDTNRDGRVDLDDFARLSAMWMQELPWAE